MKKLIIILFLFSFGLQAQTIRFAGIEMHEDKLNHFAAGYGIGLMSNIATYKLISLTKLDPELSKMFSFAIGSSLGILAGHLKEKHDEKNGKVYSKDDFNTTLYGALSGSFSMRLLLWNSIPENHLPKGEIIYDLENEIFN